jgi:spore coat polysaccharide biosynthesis protein SpsF
MKIGFLITARLKSSRLPLKILKDLKGKTVIERIIDRTKEIHGISEIVVCTSPNPQDKPLVEIAKKNNVSYFLGDEEDVLQRLFDAAKSYKLDYFLGITADNPLFSIKYSNLIVDKVKKNRSDFIKIKNLPFGTATYGMNISALATVCKIKKIVDTEIWGCLIDRPEIFDVITIEAKEKLRRPQYRLTLDYEEDYELIKHLYTNISFKNTLDLTKVVEYLDKHPDTAKINANCIQLDLAKDVKERINNYYIENHKEIMKIKKEIYSTIKK